MKELIYTLKQDLKTLAASIKTAKQSRKTRPNGFVAELAKLQFEFRVKHIFRCLLRGRTLEEIENSRLEKTPLPNSSTEIRLHLTLSHLYNVYAKTKYNHKIQCNCLNCNEEYRSSYEAMCVNS